MTEIVDQHGHEYEEDLLTLLLNDYHNKDGS